MVSVATQSLWASWFLFFMASSAVAVVSGFLCWLAISLYGFEVSFEGITTYLSTESVSTLLLFAVLVGCIVSLLPGLSLYGLYKGLTLTAERTSHYDDFGNFVLLLGSIGPSIFFIGCLLTFSACHSNPLQKPFISYNTGLSIVASLAFLFLMQRLEVF